MKAQDDPRLTAYALGELDGDEARAIEELLREDPEARQIVDEVREAARLLERELATEVSEGLTSVQRTDIEAAAAGAPERARARRRPRSGFPRRMALVASTVLVSSALGLWVWRRAAPETAPFAYNIFGSGDVRSPATAARVVGAQASLERKGVDHDALTSLGYSGPEVEITAKIDRAPEELFEVSPEEEGEYPNSGLVPTFSTEAYDRIVENPFLLARNAPLSTFSIDVDTASYANVRRYLKDGALPPPDAVRIEEFLNYFPYSDAGPTDGAPFAVHVETAGCPWAPKHRLMRVALVGRALGEAGRRPSNLVFLIDVSGSMDEPDKLPLLKHAMQLLVQNLDERDRIAIVVYAGAAGLVLPSTSVQDSWAISEAIERLSAGGSTAGGAGIELAYQVAAENFLAGGVNRVILATDGDFNVGVSDDGSLTRLIESKRDTGVFLSVLGFGTGNLKDSKLEQLADQGNGQYAYIDGPLEARKVLVEQLGGTLETIAKDVKIQVEFNPVQVEGYRLIGYENRLMAAQDFNDDTKDAGEIGAGHRVTALYELVPAGVGLEVPGVDPLRYQTPAQPSGSALSGELCTLKLRYKEPEASESRLIELPVRDTGGSFADASEDLRFASAVAGFGMWLRHSKYAGALDLAQVLRLASESAGEDRGGYRREFLELARRAAAIRER